MALMPFIRFIRRCRLAPVLATCVLCVAGAGMHSAIAAPFQDVLDVPAKQSALASKSLLNGVTNAGRRVVAVGQRGHIVYSDDSGKTWRQAKVPVSSDLVAVNFPTPKSGWAVGHDGIVLHTIDGGESWSRQLDGRSAGKLLETYYAALGGQGKLGSQEDAMRLIDETKRLAAQGAENPFLDVWFTDENTGFIVGAFNQIFRTTDAGATWEPWFHRTDNPKRLHLYAIRQVGGELYIAGEQGLVMRLDPGAGRFVGIDTGYHGTYFGIAGNDAAVFVFGLRGSLYRSGDGGRQWQKIETGLPEGITGAASCNGGRFLLVSQSGHVLESRDGGQHFTSAKIERPVPASAVACTDAGAIIAGARGVVAQTIR
jgi:photosystem II stability/assembly factor-like uncharacterized protein